MAPNTNVLSMAQFRADREFVNHIERTMGHDLPKDINARFALLLRPEVIPHGFDFLDDDHDYLRRSLIQFIHSLKSMLVNGCKDKMFSGSLPFGVDVAIQDTPTEDGPRQSEWVIRLPMLDRNAVITCTTRWLPVGTPVGDYSDYGDPLAFQSVLNEMWADCMVLPPELSPPETVQAMRETDRILGDGAFIGAMRDAVVCLLAIRGTMPLRAEPQDEDYAMNPLGARYVKGESVSVACEAVYQDDSRVVLDITYDITAVRRYLAGVVNLFG